MPEAAVITPEAFIEHWSKAEANERANSQSFLIGLTHVLGVAQPSNSHFDGYSFEYPVKVPGTGTTNFLDLYRRGCFVLESKQFTAQKEEQSILALVALKAGAVADAKKSGPVRGTGAWDDAMLRARGQAERYVRSLPAEEPNPPFIIVCDVGHSFEIYADFTQAGKAYLPYPDPRTFRLQLKGLAQEEVRERLRLIWTNPFALDPAKVSADVTREIAGYLAELAKSLELAGHDPEVVAQFLTRCLFCMFAEDVGLLPERSFTELLNSLPGDGTGFVSIVRTLFREMNEGTKGDISVVLRKKLLRFNGGLFANDTVLPVNGLQLGLLKQAAKTNWAKVEPAIFGTLLERALVPEERHALGAHFTPRAYVERLVLPTVMEPLREEWESVRAAVVVLARADDLKGARAEINRFHDHLCNVTVLDPACGSGNFLYVALEHMKRLEGEVIDLASSLGAHQRLDISTHTVDPHQFLGIELNPRAAAIAELVLWIGYLQWHFRTRGQTMPEEPVLKSFKNIQCRDAVLEYDGEPQPARDEAGNLLTVWDRRSYKTDLVANRKVPDESKRVPVLTYTNPRPAKWPQADCIVGNPPFIGKKRLRETLGEGYAETLRAAYPDVPETADFVVYWWQKAAALVRSGRVRRFGLITTNSLSQTFGSRVIQSHLSAKPPLSLVFAIADHPWVDSSEGAAVRIAMTVGCVGVHDGEVLEVRSENTANDGSVDITLDAKRGRIQSDLTVSNNQIAIQELRANSRLSSVGYQLNGTGFALDQKQAATLKATDPGGVQRYVFPLLSGRDITQTARGLLAIDLFGAHPDELRVAHPAIYQWVLTHVKPERDSNPRKSRRERWWIYGEPLSTFRPALDGLVRMVATALTAKHRTFVFTGPKTIADSTTVVFAFDDAFFMGVLSSRLHVVFSLDAGSHLGVGNDPRYNKSLCFESFPFPLCNEAEKERIRSLAEELDAHRKRVQAQHDLTLTGLYNVLEKLRSGEALNDKEKLIHDKGLVSILKQLHDDLDAAVFATYGWPATLTDAEILERLVALNAARAADEQRGIIHWLRPEYQHPSGRADRQGVLALAEKKPSKTSANPKSAIRNPKSKTPWPKPLADRIRAIEQALHAAHSPVTATDLVQRFARASTKDIQEILETLAALGRAQRSGEMFSA